MAEALAGMPLKSLNLSDNALGEKGIRAAAPAFADQANFFSDRDMMPQQTQAYSI